MARLSYDALLLLARLPAGDNHTLTKIAFDIFAGYTAHTPGIPSKVALARAQRACESLIALKRAAAIPSRRNMTAIRIYDASGGAVQAQFLMNLVVRGGEERRRDDRRVSDEPHAGERRAVERRTEIEGKPRPKRIVRAVTRVVPPRTPSPFDILDRPRPSSAPIKPTTEND